MAINWTAVQAEGNTYSNTSLIVAYYSLFLIIMGTIFNFLTFIILCRPTFCDKKSRPIIHYMRTIAVFDILVLYGRNLDHYVAAALQFHLLRYSIVSCKLITFTSYVTSQTSAWLRVFVCLDRCLSLRSQRAWITRTKTALTFIAFVIIGCTLLNLHIAIFGCYQREDGIITTQAQWYAIYPLWNYVHLVLYNCIPFVLMVTFNSYVTYNLVDLSRKPSFYHPRIHHRTIALTLLITTSLFLVMTIPATVASAFFGKANIITRHCLDALLYTYHTLSFPIYLITFHEFRREWINIFKCKPRTIKIAPVRNLSARVPTNGL